VTNMKASNLRKGAVLPPAIRITEEELHRVSALASSCMELFPQVARFLAREMERATTVANVRDLHGAIRMGSKVTYRDEGTGITRDVVLVYPNEADIEFNRISILTPVGAALIGLSAGQRIEFETPSSATRCITVLAVSDEWQAIDRLKK
jgi:regulator of nucleoside diphosphate kinase